MGAVKCERCGRVAQERTDERFFCEPCGVFLAAPTWFFTSKSEAPSASYRDQAGEPIFRLEHRYHADRKVKLRKVAGACLGGALLFGALGLLTGGEMICFLLWGFLTAMLLSAAVLSFGGSLVGRDGRTRVRVADGELRAGRRRVRIDDVEALEVKPSTGGDHTLVARTASGEVTLVPHLQDDVTAEEVRVALADELERRRRRA